MKYKASTTIEASFIRRYRFLPKNKLEVDGMSLVYEAANIHEALEQAYTDAICFNRFEPAEDAVDESIGEESMTRSVRGKNYYGGRLTVAVELQGGAQ